MQYIEDSRDMQPATPEQLQSIIHDAPCAGEAFRMALHTNTVTSSATLTFGDAKKMASECKDKEEIKAVREKKTKRTKDNKQKTREGKYGGFSKIRNFG